MQAQEMIEKIKQSAKMVGKKDERIIKKHIIGNVIRQGDLYLHMVDNNHPVGELTNKRQIADGFSIGARHILIGDVKVFDGKEFPKYVNKKYPLGYVFDYKNNSVLTHPEHAHIKFECEGRMQVTHQIDLRTLQRVND